MSTTAIAPAQSRRSFMRSVFPWLVLGLGVLGIVLFWGWPSQDIERYKRVIGAWLVGSLSALVLLVWFLFWGPLRWPARFALVVALVAAVPAAVRSVEFSGDMGLIVHWRWQPLPEDVLEAHRRGQGARNAAPVDLSAPLPTDFPGYLGWNRDGVVEGPALRRDWSARPPQQLWQQPVGSAYSGFVVVHGNLVTAEQRRQNEAIVCYDGATGREHWVYEYPAYFYEPQGGLGPRATPTVAHGDVYSYGATGRLVCVEGASGKLKWDVDTLADNDNLAWGISGSPLVYDDVVVVNPGAQRESAKGRAVVAYDRQTGREIWKAGSARAAYCSPMLATLAGRRMVLVLDSEGLAAYDAAGAGELWRFPWQTYQDINVAQPLVLAGDRIFLTSGYGHGCALLQVGQTDGEWSVQPVWQNRSLRCRFATPVYYQDHIYGLDEGILVCLDVKDGRRVWKDGRYGNGQLLRTGDLLVIMAENSDLALVEATPEAFRELGRIRVLEGDKTWNTPALADGKAYVRNHHQMAAYDLSQ